MESFDGFIIVTKQGHPWRGARGAVAVFDAPGWARHAADRLDKAVIDDPKCRHAAPFDVAPVKVQVCGLIDRHSSSGVG